MSNKTKTVLVADDYAGIREAICSILEQFRNIQVLEAIDGDDAWRLLKTNTVSLVICDWNMPGLTGLEVLKQLRAVPAYKSIPFMMVTAEIDREHVEQAIHAGADDFLIKPFTRDSMYTKIDQLLQKGKHIPLSCNNLDDNKHDAPQEKLEEVVPTVLLVDDEPAVIRIVSSYLSDDNRVLVANSAQRALEVIETRGSGNIDVILMDVVMPEMSGIEACRILKSNHDTENIPVIFLTGKTDDDDIAEGLDAGAVDYVTKPVSSTVLKARVNTQIRLKKNLDAMAKQVELLVENTHLREEIDRMTRHDLKAPLTAILNGVEYFPELGWMNADQNNQIGAIGEAAYEMLRMVNGSLDLYKMEMGNYQLSPEPVDFTAIASKVVNVARRNGQIRRISVVFLAPESCWITSEELLIYSLLSNLVKNAIEASPERSEVVFSMNTEAHRGQIEINIQNQGAVPEEIRDNFFDKYVTFGKSGGSGLGTYSAKLITETLGGCISFITSKEEGTTLRILLPKSSE